ncbi:sigma E protease regulator RseP [Pseudidiomarina sp. 1APP75-32.1]|uniref:Zinc metalloprotease n=1 Tax=Pseudidiomarina terrestris TaxID=2820060 RepID=A0AAW7QXK0_9GAMM|nr:MULTISPECIES: sigma E protease regulator RseP [unclassified Pseudidiomarina]MDN7123558.1 sigma E protease regulator RseP [Pseudidiomarina sp. 1APP75-32.1]MDN7126652.1 sigma E protease regulator RseP [Pseudidiomarina sp. 1APR75-33.1]MDN7128718.1 sigma E protease regulator RseP [Pseudidiomarina sp. 1APR75-15]MEA3587198.1 sigma E protease regulator RseP [Pseudidiomarina sp. 1APP75-27a]
MLDIIWSLGAFVVTLGVLVTFHEFGHFWVARKCGVKVLTFSVGFGKAFWQRTGKDGTVYQLSRIPLGGYVRMLDERVDDVKPADRDKSFNSKSVGQRAAIIAAGPAANFLLAVVVLWGMFVIGVPSVKPMLGSVTPNSIAAQADWPTPAEIISVNGSETEDWQQVNLAFASALGEDKATVTVRDEQQRTRTLTLDISSWRLGNEQMPTFMALGLQPYQPEVFTELDYVQENSPAAEAGLQEGDKIVAFDGTLMSDWSQIRDAIMAVPGAEVEMTVERQQVEQTIQVTIGEREVNGQTYGYLGVEPRREAYPEAYRFVQQYGIVDGLVKGAERTWELMVLSVKMIGKLITGTVSVTNLSGPVAIAEGAGVSASYGLVYFLGFLALISVNLGIINLVPLPMLDGGHLMFLAIESVRKKEVSERVQEISYRIGGALIFALMAIAISNDVLRLLR